MMSNAPHQSPCPCPSPLNRTYLVWVWWRFLNASGARPCCMVPKVLRSLPTVTLACSGLLVTTVTGQLPAVCPRARSRQLAQNNASCNHGDAMLAAFTDQHFPPLSNGEEGQQKEGGREEASKEGSEEVMLSLPSYHFATPTRPATILTLSWNGGVF